MPLDKIMDPNIAAKAYGNTLGLGQKAGGGAADDASDVSFSDFLKGTLERSSDTMRSGEEIAAKAVTGEAGLTDVVQAVSQAELTLQTIVSIRDKLISAYQDIMRTSI